MQSLKGKTNQFFGISVGAVKNIINAGNENNQLDTK